MKIAQTPGYPYNWNFNQSHCLVCWSLKYYIYIMYQMIINKEIKWFNKLNINHRKLLDIQM